MKNIKTYEGFLNWFSKKPKDKQKTTDNVVKSKTKDIKTLIDEIDSFLYDLKDISLGSHKVIFTNQIIYCFCISNYKKKKNEIDIFLEEIKSACNSINIKFEYLEKISEEYDEEYEEDDPDPSGVLIVSRNKKIDYIVLEFFIKYPPSSYQLIHVIEECARILGFDSTYGDEDEYGYNIVNNNDEEEYYEEY